MSFIFDYTKNKIYWFLEDRRIIEIPLKSIVEVVGKIDQTTMTLIPVEKVELEGCPLTDWKPTKKVDEYGNVVERARPSNNT